jgi:hypothetical protein
VDNDTDEELVSSELSELDKESVSVNELDCEIV